MNTISAPTLEALKNSTQNPTMFTANIDGDLDDILRCDAFDLRCRQNELYTRYLVLGLQKSEMLGWDDERVVAEIKDLKKAQIKKIGHQMGRVLRTITMQPELNDSLREMAFANKTSKEDLFSFYLRLGIQKATEDNLRRAWQKPTRVFRQLCFDTDVDELLHAKAKTSKKSVEDLYRHYVRLGLEAEQKQNNQSD